MRLLDYVVNSSIQSFSEPPTYLTFDPSLTLEIFRRRSLFDGRQAGREQFGWCGAVEVTIACKRPTEPPARRPAGAGSRSENLRSPKLAGLGAWCWPTQLAGAAVDPGRPAVDARNAVASHWLPTDAFVGSDDRRSESHCRSAGPRVPACAVVPCARFIAAQSPAVDCGV